MTNKIQINQVEINDGTIIIRWAKENKGFGEYVVSVEDDRIVGYSECMDRGDDKSFLVELLLAIADEVEIVE